MENIFVEFLPPWVETGLQPAFYDKESGTVLQQTARMYARVNMLIRMFNKLSRNTKTEVERFEEVVDTRVTNFENSVNETVANYIEQFNQLHDYVHDYFDNLDVQEEINNKLDDMVEAGTLQEIITTYIQSNVAWTFDNVAEMKLATNLTDDSFAQTIGFYSANDKGGALYKIRAKTNDDTVDEMTLIDLYDNTLVAELIKTDIMNVRQFGAKGDGTNDDTLAIQTALNYNPNIEVPNGTYMVNAVTKVSLNTNNKLYLDNDAIIKAIPNDAEHYAILDVRNVNNVEICGGTIEGEREDHIGETGEWGMCINIVLGSDRIYVHDINLINAWGDGIYVNTTGSVNTARVHVNNVRRNGYSIVSVNNFYSNQDHIENTRGTMPQSGVDIEPNFDTDIINNVVFNELTTNNNGDNGFIISLRALETEANIKLINYKSNNDNRGFWVQTVGNTKGNLDVIDAKIEDSTLNGIFIRPGGNSFACNFIRPIVRRYGTNNTGDSGIYVDGENTEFSHGNITLYQPIVTDPVINGATPLWAITFYFPSGVTKDNIKIIDPIALYNRGIRGLASGTNIKITDRFELFKVEGDGNYTVEGDRLNFLILGTNYTINRTVTFPSGNVLPVGYEFTFINSGAKKMNVAFPGQYIYPLSASSGTTVTLNDKGSSMKIRRIAQDQWSVLSQSGNITTN
jgi:hypothetical protein